MFYRLLPSLTLMVFAAQGAFAISPPEPWHTHRDFSADEKFYARSTPDGRTAVKQVRRWWFDRTIWATPQYFESVMVADDGSFLICSEQFIPPPYRRSEAVVWIYMSDGSIRKLPVGWFVKDLRRLPSAMGEYKVWGGRVSLEGEWVRVENREGRVSLVNAKTGKLRILNEGSLKQSRP